MNRRQTLALGGLSAFALPAVAGAAPEINPDADLISWCARWAEAMVSYSAVTEPYGRTMDDPPPEVEEQASAFWREAQDMVERIQAMPARTEAEWRAKARVALRSKLDVKDEMAEALAWGLLRDLLADDPYLVAMDRVEAARTALGVQARVSNPGHPTYDHLNVAARRLEPQLAAQAAAS